MRLTTAKNEFVSEPVAAMNNLDDLLGRVSARAAGIDAFGAFPDEDIDDLHQSGYLAAPLSPELGGSGLATDPNQLQSLFDVLAGLGGANLSLGRLYEGHVNAVRLVMAYGTPAQRQEFAHDVTAGAMSGVWNADGANGAVVTSCSRDLAQFSGGKIWASGAGRLSRAIITARHGVDTAMVLMDSQQAERVDCSGWSPSGMRATATGSIDLNGWSVHPDRIIGKPGDYLRHPLFAGGAWRYVAVHAGAVQGLAQAAVRELQDRGRTDDFSQQARFGTIAIAVDSAMAWAWRAAGAAELGKLPESSMKVEIAKARLAVERHALDVMEAVSRGIGLTGLISPSPIDRMLRDLGTYLRQPAPDQALLMVGTDMLKGRPSADRAWTGSWNVNSSSRELSA